MKEYVVVLYVKTELPEDAAVAALKAFLENATLPAEIHYVDGMVDEVYVPE